MHLLLTNDDGYDAAGLTALAAAARHFGEVTTIGPDGAFSSTSHQVTTHRPLTLVERSTNHYSLDAWPADCVRIGLVGLELAADWVLSGINHGGNLRRGCIHLRNRRRRSRSRPAGPAWCCLLPLQAPR